MSKFFQHKSRLQAGRHPCDLPPSWPGYQHSSLPRRRSHGHGLFLKLRKGAFNPIMVEIPHFLSGLGVHDPCAYRDSPGKLFGGFEEYTIILYHFIQGKDGYEQKLSEQQWIELGWTLQKVHTAKLPV